MKQQRREQGKGDGVAPVEHPVEPIEGAVELKCEDAEKRDADPEEMQRRLVQRASQPHGCADEQREEAYRRQHRIHGGAARRRRQSNLERLPCSEPQERVVEAGALVTAMLILDDVGPCPHGRAVHGEQHIAGLKAGGRGR